MIIHMRYLLIAVLLFSVMAVSCSKENSLDTGITPGDLSSSPLIRLVQKTGTDSISYDFQYDGQKRLIAVNSVEVYQGSTYVSNYAIVRDRTGRILSTILTDDQNSAPDTTMYNYNSAGILQSRVNHYILDNIPNTDSTVLLYNSAGSLLAEHYYNLNKNLAAAPILYYKIAYALDASGNITQAQDSSITAISGNTYELNSTVLYTYDAKLNPLRLPKNEAYAIGLPAFGLGFGPTVNFVTFNNLLKEDFLFPSSNIQFAYQYASYVYNDRNKPLSCKVTDTGLSDTETELIYYYQ